MRWPILDFDPAIEPHFLFVITPPFSGSTALAKLINTSERTMFLQEAGEGQWLVPGLCERDRWNPFKKIDYHSVKSVWLNTYEKRITSSKNTDVVIEKSPPNMMRIEHLARQFGSHSFLANNRDPYANCSSILYRTYAVDRLSSGEREKVVSELAASWINRSRRIRHLVRALDIPLITYEEFCREPAAVVELLRLPPGATDTIDPDAKIEVKDYGRRRVSDQNEMQIARLTEEDRRAIRRILSDQTDLLEYFGYGIME